MSLIAAAELHKFYHVVEHEGLNDSAKASHQLLDLGGAGWCVGNITDHKEAAPNDWVLLKKPKQDSISLLVTGHTYLMKVVKHQ